MVGGCGTCPKSKLLRRSLARPGPWRIIVFLIHNTESELFLVGNVDSKDRHCTARKCSGAGGRCSVTEQKHHPKDAASRSEICST